MTVESGSNEGSNHDVRPVELPGLYPEPRGKALVPRSMEVIRDVEVSATAVLGGASLTVDRLFGMREGDVLELEQGINEPIELLVEGKPVALGQIVVVGDRFGVLISKISGP